MSATLATRTEPRTPLPGALAGDPARALLSRLFAAPHELPAFAPARLHPAPAGERHPAEAHAAARAAACPDLFVVHAPDAGGERVIAEVARAAHHHEAGRVLVLSPNPAAADRITERLVRAATVATVRALADDENPARPLPAVARVTSHALGASRVDQLKRETAAALAAAEARLAALDRLAALSAEVAELTARRDGVEAQVRAEAAGHEVTAFTALIDGRKAEHEAAVRGPLEQRIAADAEAKKQDAEVARLREQLAEATRKPGFFGRLFGKANPADPAPIEKNLHEAERRASELADRAAVLRKELEAAAAALTAEREQLIAGEVAARRFPLDSRLAQLTADRQRHAAELAPCPSEGELEAARATVAAELAATRDRAAELDGNRVDLLRRLLAEPRVVVATPGSLGVDPAVDSGTPFALLILDRAEELTEADFVHLSRLATRWVLVGDVLAPPDAKVHTNGVHPRHGHRHNGRPVEVPFAARLAQVLDRERWAHEGPRLVCRLAHPTPEQRRCMTREPLLDHPEIELRFSADPATGEPVVAEVVFPPGTTVAAAKAFLFRQLGEVLLHPCGELCWDHGPTALVAHWPAADALTTVTVAWAELEPGVREKVVGGPGAAFTAAVTFDTAAGWDAEKAAAWLDLYLPDPCPTRFAVVPRTGPTPRPVPVV
jgi:hypothetical protein